MESNVSNKGNVSERKQFSIPIQKKREELCSQSICAANFRPAT